MKYKVGDKVSLKEEYAVFSSVPVYIVQVDEEDDDLQYCIEISTGNIWVPERVLEKNNERIECNTMIEYEATPKTNSFYGIDIGTIGYNTETLEYNIFDGNSFVPITPPQFSESALEPAEPLGEYKPFNHLINNKFMSIKNKIKMLMTGEPEKTLIKHGILTIDKELTVEGKQLFNEFIETKFKEEFLKELYEVLKDEKLED